MKTRTLYLLLFFITISLTSVYSQELSSRVLDSVTKEPVAFATVIFKKKGTVSNEEGRFSFVYRKNSQPTDTLTISCIGYKTIAKPLSQYKDSVILMAPKTNELKEVILTSKDYSADEIIDKVKENIKKNYNFDYTKKRLFFRESQFQSKIKNNYKIRKSTIKALNKQFLDSVISTIPDNNAYYTEILCDLYGNYDIEKQKIKFIKASELYNKDTEISLSGIEEKFNKILEENVKPDSYFKVKSGILGRKIERKDLINGELDTDNVESQELDKVLEKQRENEKNRKNNFTSFRQKGLNFMLKNLFFQRDSDLNFIRKSGRYDYELRELMYLGNDAVYVIDFTPGFRAKYKGTLYISINDFAVLRADYKNTKSLKTFKLLGVRYNAFLDKGKMIFTKGNNGKYDLKYLENENASNFGLKRPFKIIEKNKNVKGRRKQNELSMKIDMAFGNRNKKEIVFFDTEIISTSDYNSATTNTIKPVYMPRYNSEFWKGYNIIEPNKAIRDFTIVE